MYSTSVVNLVEPMPTATRYHARGMLEEFWTDRVFGIRKLGKFELPIGRGLAMEITETSRAEAETNTSATFNAFLLGTQ